MDLLIKLCITTALLMVAAIYEASGDAMVTGSVFCDQCKDGQISLFDYPLYGTKVAMVCPGNDGQPTTWWEQTTAWGGGYAMSFQGTPDLSTCYVQVLGNGGPNGCGAAAGPPKSLRLMFSMFNMEMYSVDPLLSQPAQPMSFCPRSSSPISVPNPPSPANPPPAQINPVKPPPATTSPPLPPSPPAFLEASAYSYHSWKHSEPCKRLAWLRVVRAAVYRQLGIDIQSLLGRWLTSLQHLMMP